MASVPVNPPPWERQYGATGITYSDPTLNPTLVAGGGHRDHVVGRHNERPAEHPAKFSSWNQQGRFGYGLLVSDRRETKILAWEDHQPISHAGWLAPVLGTRDEAWFLSKR
jgi:hypothetical protein